MSCNKLKGYGYGFVAMGMFNLINVRLHIHVKLKGLLYARAYRYGAAPGAGDSEPGALVHVK